MNLSERDAPAVIELLARRGIGVEAGLASAADAERLAKLPGHRPVLRILIEIQEQDLLARVAANIAVSTAGCGDPSFCTASTRYYGPLLSLRVSDVGPPGSGWRTASISPMEQ